MDEVINEDISDLAVGESGREHGDIVLPAPVEDTLLVVDLLTKSVDNLARRPNSSVFLLLLVHLLEKGSKPIIKAVVVVHRDHHVTSAVDALVMKLGT